MSTNFPTTIDAFPNPSSTDALANATTALKHSVQHADANDAIAALEAKVGVDGSAVPTSLDYKVAHGGALRTTASATSSSLAANAQDTAQNVAVGKGCMAIRLATNYPAWVRIYSTAAAQSADATRLQSVDATGEHGMLLEVITTGSNLSIDLGPAAMLFSLESSPGTTLPITIVNLDSVSRAITATVTVVPLEG